jgi:hypothetical protein
MGILDDAIRDHLDLKRRRGTDEPEIKRLEDEAFGPAGRPDASGTLGATASAVATPPAESSSAPGTSEELELESPLDAAVAEPPAAETPPPDGPAPETPPAPQPEATPGESGGAGETPEGEGGVVFHDFAAEEGLVGTGRPDAELQEPTAPEAEAPAPGSEDTQVHDMAQELGLGDREEDAATAEQESATDAGGEDEAALGELDMDELDLELEDEELELSGEVGDSGVNGSGEPPEPAGSVEVVEESEEAAAVESSPDELEEPDEGEDVLEETPDFLRDAPESDRLWFEQGKPKDFDFDEDE